jgi:hypothetical protein
MDRWSVVGVGSTNFLAETANPGTAAQRRLIGRPELLQRREQL